MKRNKVAGVKFNVTPKVAIRVIENADSEDVIKQKKKYPFILKNDVIVTVFTDKFNFSFKIRSDYIWNGADIPKPLWWVGSSKDNDYLVASMVHDFMLEFKQFIYNDVLKGCIAVSEYRRLTSLIFREILKDSDINCVKANVMAFCVDVFQMTLNRKAWRFEKDDQKLILDSSSGGGGE